MCNETVGIGERKWGIPCQVTYNSTVELHFLSCVLFYLFKDDRVVIKQRKWLVRTKEEKTRKAHPS